jgi:copper chaperone
MKLPILLLTAATATTIGLCDLCAPTRVARAAEPTFARAAATLDTVTLHIEGMTCGGCTRATRTVLERLDGVTRAVVDYDHKRAVVTFDPTKVTVAQMIAAVATLKYTATVVTL